MLFRPPVVVYGFRGEVRLHNNGVSVRYSVTSQANEACDMDFSRVEDTANITVLNSTETRSFSLSDRIYTPRALYVARASTASTKCKTPLMEIGRMQNTVWDFTGSLARVRLTRSNSTLDSREPRYERKRGSNNYSWTTVPLFGFTRYSDTHNRAVLPRRNYANGNASGNTRDYTLRDMHSRPR
ncbi:hypothetical protein ALC57_04314 [Trachymyrmex cornetzi]|uniref:Uncharacterized protein n=1 Tax=Trachymyrmex cornetzi TaxID=471704 RepID=A0A195EDY6_9HYME|nr:hypothetical protein ALC57_04314 [Trachymyrmex cornetzi]